MLNKQGDLIDQSVPPHPSLSPDNLEFSKAIARGRVYRITPPFKKKVAITYLFIEIFASFLRNFHHIMYISTLFLNYYSKVNVVY